MKKIFIIPVISLLVGCLAPNYYQVYTTSSSDLDSLAVFTSGDFTMKFDMWEHEGNSSFTFHNRSGGEVTVLLDRSFLITNGLAYPLYTAAEHAVNTGQQQLYFYPVGDGYYAGTFPNEMGRTTTYIREARLVIPPHSYRTVYSPALVSSAITSCDINETPRAEQEVTIINYTKEESPYVYESSVSFMVNGEDSIRTLRPAFYVSSIKNISQSMMYRQEEIKDCEGWEKQIEVNVIRRPNMFYVRYTSF